ncbi:11548_t:CDS:1, partial [Ambispora gerdemannii]
MGAVKSRLHISSLKKQKSEKTNSRINKISESTRKKTSSKNETVKLKHSEAIAPPDFATIRSKSLIHEEWELCTTFQSSPPTIHQIIDSLLNIVNHLNIYFGADKLLVREITKWIYKHDNIEPWKIIEFLETEISPTSTTITGEKPKYISLLAFLYFLGIGTTVNYKESKRLYEIAAGMNDGVAQCQLGTFLYFGIECEADYDLAFRFFMKCADQGIATGQA